MTKNSQQSNIEAERGLENVIDQLLKQKRENWKKEYFPTVRNNQSPNSGFLEISLLLSQHFSFMEFRCVEEVYTVATKGSCCFILISGFIDETQMYDTIYKRSFDPSDYKIKRCLNFLKFARTESSYKSHKTNQIFNLIEGSNPQLSAQNLKLDSLKQNTEIASEELSSAIQSSKSDAFFGLFLNLPVIFDIKANRNKERTGVLDAEERFKE